MEQHFDLLIIGAGPGGYVAAKKAAKLGMSVAVIDKDELGGTCINRGCIPTKALIHAASLFREMRECERFGLSAREVGFDLRKIYEYKDLSAAEMRAELEREFAQAGIRFIKGKAVIQSDRRVRVVSDGNDTAYYKGKYILIAAGAKANMVDLPGIDLPGVMTSMPDVYAVGDVTGGIQLAHVASAQGTYVVERMNGVQPSVIIEMVPSCLFTPISIVPSCLYTDPEIASVGITEEEARKKGVPVRCGRYTMSVNGQAIISKEEKGFIKVLFAADSDVLLGAQVMCPRATDMIGELATAIANGLTSTQLMYAMRAHPTFNEAISCAVENSRESKSRW